jgi:endonuclease III
LCRPVNPLCNECPLVHHCPEGKRNLDYTLDYSSD